MERAMGEFYFPFYLVFEKIEMSTGLKRRFGVFAG
tara:strand:- start:177 stop:281 length:105 start_codon:yes stop_codon:yes gene_type:complete